VFPLVAASILLVLYLAYRDWAHAGLMMLAVPGALAGGVFSRRSWATTSAWRSGSATSRASAWRRRPGS
jgi:hypothetical protein